MYNSYNHFDHDAMLLVMVVIFVVAIIFLIPWIFYLVTLQNTLKAVSVQNRTMTPGQVWMVFIPFFGIVWQFIMVQRIAESLKAEFNMRQIPTKEEKPAYGVGLAMCICSCCGVIPFLSFFTGIGFLVLWIIYWVKIADYKRQLDQLNMNKTMAF